VTTLYAHYREAPRNNNGRTQMRYRATLLKAGDAQVWRCDCEAHLTRRAALNCAKRELARRDRLPLMPSRRKAAKPADQRMTDPHGG